MPARLIAGGVLILLPLLYACSAKPLAATENSKTETAAVASPTPAEAQVALPPAVAATPALPESAPAAPPATTPPASAPATPTSAPATTGKVPEIQKYFGQKVTHGWTGSKKIAFTFDDGPHPTRTPQVIAILKKAGIPATFFMLGEMVKDFPAVAKQVADAGFEIGNHSFSHPNMRRLDMAGIAKQLGDTAALIESAGGRRPYLFRPPYGEVSPALREVCRKEGYAIILWSVDTRDWAQGSSSQSVLKVVTTETRGGAIVLMHDVHERSIQALPAMIEDLKAKGYQFTTVGQLLEEAAQVPEPAPGTGGAPGTVGETMGGGMGSGDPAPAKPLAIPLEDSAVK